MRSRLNASFCGVCMIGLQTGWAAAQPRMVITEWMYQGGTATGGEYVEFTNVGDQPADLTGWSFDDSARQPGSFDLSPLGTVLPGESVLIAEDPAEVFRSVWGIGGGIKVVGELGLKTGSNLGRSDEINLFDADGDLVDRLTYGDETFPGTPRTRWVSGNPAIAGGVGRERCL